MNVLFALIFFGTPVLTLAWWAWADRRVRAAKLPSEGKPEATAAWCWARATLLGFAVTFLLGTAWLLIGRLVPHWLVEIGLPRTPHPWLMAMLMLWAILVLPLVAIPSMVAWTAWRLVAGIRGVAHWARHRGQALPTSIDAGTPFSMAQDDFRPTPELTRRQLLAATMATAPVWTTLGLTGFGLVQKRHFRIRELSVYLPTLPAGLDGMTIAQVSDTHVGKFTKGEILDRIADATNDLQADLVLLTGDLIDHSVHDLPEAVRMLDRIERRSGMFLIEGNHDLFDGRAAFANGLRDADMPLLLNETATVRLRGHAVQILGMMWHGRGASVEGQVDLIASQRDPAAFPILLAHHPHAFDRAAGLGLPLTLAGHTHGGQLMLTPEFGAGPALFKYWSGIYEQQSSRLVVSNGAGNWFPLRTNAPAEILHLTLRRV